MACGEYFVRHSSRQRYCNNPNCQAERNNRKTRAYYEQKKNNSKTNVCYCLLFETLDNYRDPIYKHIYQTYTSYYAMSLKRYFLSICIDLSRKCDIIILREGGLNISVSYKKLMHPMIEQDITASQLQKRANISGNVFTRIRRNEYVSLESIEAICSVLKCGMDDIIDFLPVGTNEVDENEK